MLGEKKGHENNNNNNNKKNMEQRWRMKSGVWFLLQI